MTRRLMIAAGGGGDAIAAAMIHRATSPLGTTAWIMSFSWDRLVVDPIPGPRDPSWFDGLEPHGEFNFRLNENTTVRQPAGSTLPRLASELDAAAFLLDPRGGALGLQRQLAELANLAQVDAVEIVDVGGDILARGDEPELRSPLADSLVLAAAAHTDLETTVLVAGAGLDGELSEELVLSRCDELGSRTMHRLAADEVEPFGALFEWHPSEATGLLWAAAMGARGVAEIRDQGARVALTEHTADVHTLRGDATYRANDLAAKLTGSRSLDDAETAIREARGSSEIDYERSKAGKLSLRSEASPRDLAWVLEQLPAVEADARAAGVDFITLRRLGERLGLRGGELATAHDELRTLYPNRFAPPLWRLSES